MSIHRRIEVRFPAVELIPNVDTSPSGLSPLPSSLIPRNR